MPGGLLIIGGIPILSLKSGIFNLPLMLSCPNGWVVVCPYIKGLDYLFQMVYYLNIKNDQPTEDLLSSSCSQKVLQ
jgi:hypothetical protein